MLASLSGNATAGEGGVPGLPAEFANNPLFAALSSMGAGGGGMGNMGMGQGLGAQASDSMAHERKKSIWERMLPLLHLVSMVGLAVWAVWVGEGVSWSTLPLRSENTKEWVEGVVGIVKPVVSSVCMSNLEGANRESSRCFMLSLLYSWYYKVCRSFSPKSVLFAFYSVPC